MAWLAMTAAWSLTPARAQPPAAAPAPHDAIGDILDRRVPPPRDEDEPDTAGQPPTSPEPEPTLEPQPGPPVPYAPAPRTQQGGPVLVDETGKTPDGPPAVRDLAYDARIRASFASAESFQGPLDGGWTLSESRNGDRFAFQIVDRRDRLEAVWRDLRRTGSLNASGIVADIQRNGSALTLRFGEPPGSPSLVTLRQGADGQWSGELARGGEVVAVTLRRTGP